ncbi:MAG TPA: hypothetical protein PKL31_10035 [Fulvivirga sp.]|nr:hypothetical protein [Fulvivirga sp.]
MENADLILKLVISLIISFVFYVGVLLVLMKLFFKKEDSQGYEQRLKRFLERNSTKKPIKELTHQK